jgi:hypothetical protein
MDSEAAGLSDSAFFAFVQPRHPEGAFYHIFSVCSNEFRIFLRVFFGFIMPSHQNHLNCP